jgi:hypothetical protein
MINGDLFSIKRDAFNAMAARLPAKPGARLPWE